jgi:hypothetical protein
MAASFRLGPSRAAKLTPDGNLTSRHTGVCDPRTGGSIQFPTTFFCHNYYSEAGREDAARLVLKFDAPLIIADGMEYDVSRGCTQSEAFERKFPISDEAPTSGGCYRGISHAQRL